MSNFRLFSIVLTFVLSILISTAVASTWEGNVVAGVIVFKTTPEFKVDLPVEGDLRFGVSHIDRFMEDLGALRVERKFPHCYPPKPGGTDLTRIYNLYFPEEIPVRSVCSDLLNLDGIEYAEPWYLVPYHMEYNDPRYEDQYSLERIEADRAHDISTGDRTVPVAIVDTGIDMDHEDLIANLWINPGEDLNGDGEIQNNERNRRDDDDNGYVDDFYGWDFDDNDNYPDDPGNGMAAGHGTHCAGIASAVTNNRVGIASVGYSCGILPIRAGGRQGEEAEYYAEGVEYAATVGAKVISCSWGPPMDIRVIRDACDYAYEHDALMVGAAGNLDPQMPMIRPEDPIYPAAYDNVIAVAGTDQNDRKWGDEDEGSNYGRWVDISAPGYEILSTFLRDGYEVHSGTSMATPLAAGVAVLLRATFPDLNVDEIVDLFLEGADDIEDQNRNYHGKLGAGRVNPYNSLLLGPLVTITIGDIEIISDDNDNGAMDPGETVQLTITLSNGEDGDPIENIVVTLSCEDDDITFNNDEFEIDLLEPDDSFTNEDNPFELEINGDVVAHTTWLTLSVVSEDADLEEEKIFEMVIGHPDILIVDDDGGEDLEYRYFTTIEEMGQGWARWDVDAMEEPPAEEILRGYDLVIWATGNTNPPLDDNDRWELEEALDGGVNILLIGEYIGDDDTNFELLRDGFGAINQHDVVGASVVRGMSDGSPLSEDVSMFLSADEGGGSDSPTSMVATENGRELAVYRIGEQTTGVAGVFMHNPDTDSRTIYLGFAFEAVADHLTPKHEVLSILADWFAGNWTTPFDRALVPGEFKLDLAYPNPFNGVITLNFNLPERSDYRLTIMSISGREVAIAGQGFSASGDYSFSWDATHQPSGLYFVRLSVPGRAPIARRLVLVK